MMICLINRHDQNVSEPIVMASRTTPALVVQPQREVIAVTSTMTLRTVDDSSHEIMVSLELVSSSKSENEKETKLKTADQTQQPEQSLVKVDKKNHHVDDNATALLLP